jgi:hypothetical protein
MKLHEKLAIERALEPALKRAQSEANLNLPSDSDPDNWNWLSQQDRARRVAQQAYKIACLRAGRTLCAEAEEYALDTVTRQQFY